jgi:hypothetical protein
MKLAWMEVILVVVGNSLLGVQWFQFFCAGKKNVLMTSIYTVLVFVLVFVFFFALRNIVRMDT